MERFEPHGWTVAERAVETLGVLKECSIHGAIAIELHSPLLAVEQLDLHRSPERLHRGIEAFVCPRNSETSQCADWGRLNLRPSCYET